MLGHWMVETDYRASVQHFVAGLSDYEHEIWCGKYRTYYHALRRLRTDAARDYLCGLYSHTGRPATNQCQILLSFILMGRMGETSLTKWVEIVRTDRMIRALIGVFGNDKPPVLGDYYHFIDRLWTQPWKEQLLGRRDTLPYNHNLRPTDKKPGKGNKWEETRGTITEECEKLILSEKDFPQYYEVHMQQLFRILGLKPSQAAGLLNGVDTISGDGTCFHEFASPSGCRIGECTCGHKEGDRCTCPRHFSDPSATWGYDSDEDIYYFGHTLYTLCVHNSDLAIDLPVHIRTATARRHDSVTGLVALNEYFRVNPDISFSNLCLDSAHDNYPTYRLCQNFWHINPFIDLNIKRGRPKVIHDTVSIDSDGTPMCQAGKRMVFSGIDRSRNRCKYRCPYAAANQDQNQCPCKGQCSSSNYGRTVYTHPEWDIRLYTPVPRGTDAYKAVYNNRTSCERMNNRLLNDYHLHTWRGRTRKRLAFFSTFAAINVHLDAQLKVLKDTA